MTRTIESTGGGRRMTIKKHDVQFGAPEAKSPRGHCGRLELARTKKFRGNGMDDALQLPRMEWMLDACCWSLDGAGLDDDAAAGSGVAIARGVCPKIWNEI